MYAVPGSWLMNVCGAGQYGCMLCQVTVDECAQHWSMCMVLVHARPPSHCHNKFV